MKVLLLDESAGGFGVLSEQLPSVESGEKGLLHVGDNWCEVRLVNIKAVEADPIDASDDSSTTPPVTATIYRLGLCRLGDAFDPDIKPVFYSWAGLRCHLDRTQSTTWGMIVLGALLAVCVIASPYVSVQLMSPEGKPEVVKKKNLWLNISPPPVSKTANPDRPSDLADKKEVAWVESFARSNEKTAIEVQKLTAASKLVKPEILSKINDNVAELQKKIANLPGAMSFTLPEVVRQLQLTETQQNRIRELIDSATSMIKSLGGSPDKIQADKASLFEKTIMDSTLNKVMEILDDNQKKKWRELSTEAESSPNN